MPNDNDWYKEAAEAQRKEAEKASGCINAPFEFMIFFVIFCFIIAYIGMGVQWLWNLIPW